MIECVSIDNNHLFSGNPLAEQHRLRYNSIITRQNWGVPCINHMEYDQYDNPATKYLIWRDVKGKAGGVSRLYPTDRPYMLQEVFSHLATEIELPNTRRVWEGSRFCVDESLPPEARKRIIQEIIVGYLEFGLKNNIDRFIGVMYPAYWRNIFIKSGWGVDWVGQVTKLEDGNRVRAGWVKVSEEVLARVRDTTGIHHAVLNDGIAEEKIAA